MALLELVPMVVGGLYQDDVMLVPGPSDVSEFERLQLERDEEEYVRLRLQRGSIGSFESEMSENTGTEDDNEYEGEGVEDIYVAEE